MGRIQSIRNDTIMSNLEKLNFAIIGCGRISNRHAGHIAKQGNLVAVCDVIEERAKTLGEEYGANWYGSVDEMLKAEQGNIDVVSICCFETKLRHHIDI